MPGTIVGLFTGATNTPIPKRPDRWLNMMYGWPPESNIRDREDSPGAQCPYNPWPNGDCIGDETAGMCVTKSTVLDDDIRLGGTKASCYSVTGICYDSAGNPAPGVTVELWEVQPGWSPSMLPAERLRLIATTVTNVNGVYGFAVSTTVTKYKVEAYDGSKGGVTMRELVGA